MSKIKFVIIVAFAIGMIQIAGLNYIPQSWTAPYFSLILLIDVTLMFITFNYIDKTYKE